MKKCSKCSIEKDFSEFKKHKLHYDGFYSQCKMCVRIKRSSEDYKKRESISKKLRYQRLEVQEDSRRRSAEFRATERGKLYVLNDSLQRTYGITLEKYNELFHAQKGCCAICERHQSLFSKRLCVDHDHETNQIRALLCHHCNTALGGFSEDVNLMLKAIDFVKKHKIQKLQIVGGN